MRSFRHFRSRSVHATSSLLRIAVELRMVRRSVVGRKAVSRIAIYRLSPFPTVSHALCVTLGRFDSISQLNDTRSTPSGFSRLRQRSSETSTLSPPCELHEVKDKIVAADKTTETMRFNLFIFFGLVWCLFYLSDDQSFVWAKGERGFGLNVLNVSGLRIPAL